MDTADGKTAFLIIGLKSDASKIQGIVRDIGAEPYDPEERAELSPEHLQGLEARVQKESAELAAVREKAASLAEEERAFLLSLLKMLRKEMLKQRMLTRFRHTDRTCLLSGWLPAEQREAVIRELKKTTKNRCVIETVPAEDLESVKTGKVQVPVRMRNPSFFRPFELLTSAYGLPAYRTLDPTPILGISFLLMFGMMFGDIGHGLVLALAGLLIIRKARKDSGRAAGRLVFYGGIASIVFGFLFGSIFGLEHILPALWVKPIDSISLLFKMTIGFGIVMISLSMVMNIINGFRRGDPLSSIFDKAGLIAMILYWCSILVAMRAVTPGMPALPIIIPVLMISALILLFLKEPVVHLLEGKKNLFPEGVATGIMGGIVEILEIVLGFLANTVSFIRVAAFGLAHAGLFMAIFALSDAVKDSAFGLVSALILFFGNILIICLEGLVVSIQAVRLEFYEFFSRFFQQSETGYKPVNAEM
jgi:V/A-type H+-transporting ATPase subunit I